MPRTKSTPAFFTCQHCGRVFERHPSRAAHGRAKHCSRACYQAAIAARHVADNRTCAHCGAPFYVSGKDRYCSPVCGNRARRGRPSRRRVERVARACLTCGAALLIAPSLAAMGRGKYCNLACYRQSRPPRATPIAVPRTGPRAGGWRGGPVQRTCEQCGATFWAIRSRVDKGKARFCSSPCHDRFRVSRDVTARRGGARYSAWRTAVYKRDNFTCQHCGCGKVYLNAHHIKCWNDFPALRYDVTNGITLCESCHTMLHQQVPLVRTYK